MALPGFISCKILKTEPGCFLSDGSICLENHCNSRSIAYILELFDVSPDIVGLILVLCRHHQSECRVNVRGGVCPGFLMNFCNKCSRKESQEQQTSKEVELAHTKHSLGVVQGPGIQ